MAVLTSATLRFQWYVLLDKYTLVRYHLKLEMYILNKMKLNKLAIPYYGKKLNNSIVHFDGATYSKLHVPVIRNIRVKTNLK